VILLPIIVNGNTHKSILQNTHNHEIPASDSTARNSYHLKRLFRDLSSEAFNSYNRTKGSYIGNAF